MINLLFINVGTSEIVFLSIFALLIAFPLVLAVTALWDVFKRDFEGKITDKILIILLILCAPLVGTLVYILLIRRHYPIKLKYEKI